MQEIEGVRHAIQYYSRKLTPAELNYSATEIECLAVVDALKVMRP